MIGLLVWLAGSAALLWVMTSHHYWHDLLAAMASLALVLWVLGGAAVISGKIRGSGRSKLTLDEYKKAAERAAAAQAETARIYDRKTP